MLKSIEQKTTKYIDFVKVIAALNGHEEELGDKFWDHVMESRYGNQKFTNDTLFVYDTNSIDPEMEGVYEHKFLTRNEANIIFSLLAEYQSFKDTCIIFDVHW